MKLIQDTKEFFKRPFFSDERTLWGLWMLLPLIAALLKIHKHNNYLIFRGVFGIRGIRYRYTPNIRRSISIPTTTVRFSAW